MFVQTRHGQDCFNIGETEENNQTQTMPLHGLGSYWDGSLAVLRWFFHSFLEIAWLTCLVRHLALRWLNSKKAHDRFLNMQHDVSDLVSNINSPKAGLCAYELWKGVPGAQCAPAMSVKPVRAAHFDEASLMAGSQVWRVWTVIGSVWKCL